MNVTFGPRGILQIDNARITFRNFSGLASKFNREGDRNFVLIIDDVEIADAMEKEGWNVKRKPPREEGDLPFMFLPVKVKFNNRGPNVYLKSGESMVKLDEESIDCLDTADILDVSLDIRPYDWEVNGKEGRTAYLQAAQITQQIDRLGS